MVTKAGKEIGEESFSQGDQERIFDLIRLKKITLNSPISL